MTRGLPRVWCKARQQHHSLQQKALHRPVPAYIPAPYQHTKGSASPGHTARSTPRRASSASTRSMPRVVCSRATLNFPNGRKTEAEIQATRAPTAALGSHSYGAGAPPSGACSATPFPDPSLVPSPDPPSAASSSVCSSSSATVVPLRCKIYISILLQNLEKP